jgi:hypothetical protein
MTPITENRLQLAAQRVGLRVIVDRYARMMTGEKRYLLRPSLDARYVVQVRPDGDYELAQFSAYARWRTGSRLTLDELEIFLAHCADRCRPTQV